LPPPPSPPPPSPPSFPPFPPNGVIDPPDGVFDWRAYGRPRESCASVCAPGVCNPKAQRDVTNFDIDYLLPGNNWAFFQKTSGWTDLRGAPFFWRDAT
jgi:hypothetical protein